MPSWRDLSGLASGLAGDARRAMDRALGKTGAYRVIGYRGYATTERALVLGRVLEHTRIATAKPSQARWRNLLAMVQRIDADPLPFANVRARLCARETKVVADDEGFINRWIEPGGLLRAGAWPDVHLELAATAETPIAAAANVPQGEWIIVVGGASYLIELMGIAGGVNAFADANVAYPKVTLEEVLARDPDVILDRADMADQSAATEAQKRAVINLWRAYPKLKAVKHDRVVFGISDIFFVPGPRIVDAAQAFAKMLHPEVKW